MIRLRPGGRRLPRRGKTIRQLIQNGASCKGSGSLDGIPMTDLLSCDLGSTDGAPAQPSGAGPSDKPPLDPHFRALGYLA